MSAELEDIHEECGIFGVWGHPDASRLTYFGLHALQHRGQEGAGIVSNDNGHLIGHPLRRPRPRPSCASAMSRF